MRVLPLLLMIALGGCDQQQPHDTGLSTAAAVAVSESDLALKLKLEPQFSSRNLLPDWKGPQLAVLNFRSMSTATALPHLDSSTVMAYAFISPRKVQGYESAFMDQPLLEHFEWYKDTGEHRYGLAFRTYQVVEVDGYPRSELYLKDQRYHDFFMHCGIQAISSEDLCTLGRAVRVTPVNASAVRTVTVNIYIKLSKNAKGDWKTIESRVTRFMLNRLTLAPATVASPAAEYL